MARPTLWRGNIPRRASAVTDLVVESIMTMQSRDIEDTKGLISWKSDFRWSIEQLESRRNGDDGDLWIWRCTCLSLAG